MFLTRKIGSVFRGKATPLQVMLATVLGGLLGFVPGFFLPGDLGGGFLQAPGLILVLLCLVLVLNANLGVFGLVTLGAKLLSLVLLPVSYTIGGWLLDGPVQGVFRSLVNGKVTAWFGLEYYATAGGLVLGLVFGVLSGTLLNRSIRALRTHMATLEETSDKYQKYSSKKSVRFLSWLFLGKGKGKTSWRDLAEQKKLGLPIRLSGVLVAAVLVGSVWVFAMWFSTPILTQNLRAGLEGANGATVDLKAASIGLGDGRMRLEGLAIADSKSVGSDGKLTHDLVAADTVEATVDTGELLRKRLVIDNVVAANARGGSPRSTPGVLIPGAPPPPEPPAPPGSSKTIEDYLKDFEVWKGRLQQAREWIDAIAGGEPAPTGEPTPEQREAERQRQEAERKRMEATGLARVVATHLLDEAPRIVIRKIDIKGIGYSVNGKPDKLDLLASNLSDALLADAPKLDLKAQSGALEFNLLGRSTTKQDLGVSFLMKALPVDSVFGQLKIGGAPPLRGGTMDLSATGSLASLAGKALSLELPLQVALKDTTFALAGAKETKVGSLLLPIGLRGPVTNPSVALDDKVLQDALLKAGQAELANFVQGQAGKLLGGLPTNLQGVDVGKVLQGDLGDAKAKAEAEAKRLADEAKKKAEEEAKKKLLDEAKKKLPGGLQGLIPGGGEKKN